MIRKRRGYSTVSSLRPFVVPADESSYIMFMILYSEYIKIRILRITIIYLNINICNDFGIFNNFIKNLNEFYQKIIHAF